MGVVVRRYIYFLIIIITYLYSTCISSFFGGSIPTSLLIFKMFFRSCLLFLCNIASIAQRTFEIVQKLRSRRTWQYNYIDKNVRGLCARESPETSMCKVSCDVSRKLQLTLCAIMAS